MSSNRYREILRSVKFLLFSVSAGVIEMGAFSLLNEFAKWNYWACYLIALVLSVLWNFTLNRRYTFQSASNVPVAMVKVAGFYCVFTPLSTVGGNYLAGTLHWNAYLVTILNMVCNFVLEFLYDRFFVFGKTIDTNDIAKRNAGQDRN
jgi:putative flippase GtrA